MNALLTVFTFFQILSSASAVPLTSADQVANIVVNASTIPGGLQIEDEISLLWQSGQTARAEEPDQQEGLPFFNTLVQLRAQDHLIHQILDHFEDLILRHSLSPISWRVR